MPGATLDIVIPLYDEEAVLPALIGELERALSPEALAARGISAARCLFVDDGSSDGSLAVLRGARPAGIRVSVLRLSRNFGHQAAITAGVAHATADWVAVMDADLQDPPACILEMLERGRRGADVVYGQRRSRQESGLLRLCYAAFYAIYRLLSPIAVPAHAGDFCLMSRRVVDELNRLPERVRFARGLRSWVGFRQEAVAYDRPARAAGDSRYGLRGLYRLATDGIAALSLRPLQVAQALAVLYLLLSAGVVLASLADVFEGVPAEARFDILLALVLFSNAIVLFCLYILGAYLGRTYLEVKGRPTYIVAEVVELHDGAPG